MRIVFMGTPDFAVPVLEKIYDAGYTISAVVTQPDRPRGRGCKLTFSSVKEKALELGLNVMQPRRVKDEEFIHTLQEIKPDLLIVAAFGQILPEEVLKTPVYGCLNVHASLLPLYRGAAPIQRAIMQGEKISGVTIMLMDKGLDTGDMLAKEKIKITADMNYGMLHDSLSLVGAELLLKTIPLWKDGKIKAISQMGMASSYASPLKKEDEIIYWRNSASVIYNQIRALDPCPGAATTFQDKPLKIRACEQYNTVHQGAEPGTVLLLLKGQGFVVQTGEGCLLVKQVQPMGKNIMSAYSFINGYHLEVGYVFNN